VDNETHTEWPIFVDLQLESHPVAVDGEKHNKDPILLCDDEESERTMKLMGIIFLKIFIILRMFILENIFIVEGKEGLGSLLEVTRWIRSVQDFVGSCLRNTSFSIQVWRRGTSTSGERRMGIGNWQSFCWYEHVYHGSTSWIYNFTCFGNIEWKTKWLSDKEPPTGFRWKNWTRVFSLFDFWAQVHIPYICKYMVLDSSV